MPFGVRVAVIEPGAIKTKAWDNRVREPRVKSEDSPYSAVLKGFDSPLGAMFERASVPDQVAAAIMEVISSPQPKLRYPVGQDGIAMLEKKKELTDEQLAEYMRSSMAGVAPSQRWY